MWHPVRTSYLAPAPKSDDIVPMKLSDRIIAWDGKSAAAIAQVYAGHSGNPDFAALLIGLSADRRLERGATWLIKHHLEATGSGLPAAQSATLIVQCEAFVDWQARLHVLQILDRMEISDEIIPVLHRCIDAAIDDNNNFIRAWGFNGLLVLAAVQPSFRDEARRILEHGLEREHAASVKVRIRKALTALG